MEEESVIRELLDVMPQQGRVEWVSTRPRRRQPPVPAEAVQVTPEEGLVGDHYAGRSGKRQVTLIQGEHLDAVASILGRDRIDPALTRRNIVVRGINLLALNGRRFRIGTAVLEATGLCHPCTRMEENLGPGGYNAMRGHGGITARVVEGGTIRIGDAVVLLKSTEG
ncbi:MAG: MOSC domain-containing protein [Bacteroidetes bacterium]|nr:MAG: MOSC domain-containing protein [Bacteroidota bacterium]